MHLLLLPLPGAFSEPLPTQIKSPLGVPTILWASSKLPSSPCVVTLHPSVQLPHLTDMETEAQKGKVTCWRWSRAGAQPRAFHRPTCSLCCLPFLGTPPTGDQMWCPTRAGGGVGGVKETCASTMCQVLCQDEIPEGSLWEPPSFPEGDMRFRRKRLAKVT